MRHFYKNILSGIVAIVFMMMAAACSSFDANAEFDSADRAVAAGEFETATDICNSLLAKHESQLSATQFARLSMLFMQLTDKGDDGNGVTHAAQCWVNAMKLNPDSAMHYYATVPVDQQKNVILLNAIVSMFNHSEAIPGLEGEDNIEGDSILDLPADIDIDPNDTDHNHSHE